MYETNIGAFLAEARLRSWMARAGCRRIYEAGSAQLTLRLYHSGLTILPDCHHS